MTRWKQVKIGAVCLVERGSSPRPIDKYITDDPSGVNWIKIGDTTESMYITCTAQKILPAGAKKSRVVHAGDFLLSNSMSFGRPYILSIDGCIHDGWLVLKDPDNAFDKHFLYYCLSSPAIYAKFKAMAVGGVVNNLNSEMVRNVEIPFPPLEEQRRIAAVLDKVTDLIAKRQAQLDKLDELVKARFVEMFGEPGTDQKGGGMVCLGSLCIINPKKSQEKRLSSDLRVSFIPMTAVTENGGIDVSETKTYNEVKTGLLTLRKKMFCLQKSHLAWKTVREPLRKDFAMVSVSVLQNFMFFGQYPASQIHIGFIALPLFHSLGKMPPVI